MKDRSPQLDSLVSLINRPVKSREGREQEGVYKARCKNILGSDFHKLKPKNILGAKTIPVSAGVDVEEWAMRQEAAALLIEEGRPLPSYLRNHVVEYLRGVSQPPSKTVNKNNSRDFFIAWAVVVASNELSLLPTRNDESPNESACDVVGIKTFMSYQAVKAIYFKGKDFAEASERLRLKYSKKT